ncbi:MAG TPA: acetylornithine/succinylornithine family transaminase [Vicinamibacterales bacterium]
MNTNLDDIRAREQQHVLQTYRRQPVAFVKGEGSRIFDDAGRSYLDLVSGIGVTSLGHAHPGLTAVITDQAAKLLHTSNLYFHPFQAEAAARLSALSGLQRTFFCNSGTEANEACLKFARRFWYTQGVTDRVGYVAVQNGFAGRTMGALSVTWDEHYRSPFQPLIGPVTFVDPEQPDTLRTAVGGKTAAIIAEPIRGEGGVRPLPDGFVRAVKDVCAETGTLLIADEVQSGLGRTGHAFHFQSLGWTPDLVSVGKALGSGVPVAAALVSERVSCKISAGDHGSTYGGNLLACRAAAFFLEQLMDKGLLDHVRSMGAHFERRLRTLALRHPVIVETRGAGLMRGIELRVDAAPVVESARQHGLLVNRTAERVVRLLPPLTIQTADIDEAVDILDGVFAELPAEVGA